MKPCFDSLTRSFVAAFGALSLLTVSSLGAGAELIPLSAQRLVVEVKPGEIIGNEQVVRSFVSSGTNQFMFVMPLDVRNESFKPDTVSLQSKDGRFFINLRVLSTGTETSGPSHAAIQKACLLGDSGEVDGLEEFSTVVAGRPAVGTQFRQRVPQIGQRLVRVLWVPCRAGLVEFVLNADFTCAKRAREILDCVVLNFQTDDAGRIVVEPRSDKS